MSKDEQQKTEEEVIKLAKDWARFRFSVLKSEVDTIEVSIKAYNEIESEEMFGKSSGTYFVALEVPKVVPTILLEIFNGRDLSIEAIYFEQEH